MRRAREQRKQLGRSRMAALLLCMQLGFCVAGWFSGVPSAKAQGLTDNLIDEVEYIAPRLPSDVDPYDPEQPDKLQPEQLYAKAAILIETSTGQVIFEKNPDQVMYPASTTKILTTLLGLEMGDLTQEVTMSEISGTLPEGSSTIPLKIGETIRFEDLLFATMVRSGNEGANLIAEVISGSNQAFAELMNQAVAAYGCTNTQFANPSGLHDPNHYTTPRDMAKIARIAMENETFRAIAKTTSYSLPKSNLTGKRVLVSSSDALFNPNLEDNDFYYPYAIGIKTGYLSRAGYCYVGAAKKDGVELISVLFYTSREGRWTDTAKLMEYGFSQFVSVTPMELYNKNPIVVETAGFSMEDTGLGRLQMDARAMENGRIYHIVTTRQEADSMARNLKQMVLIDYTRDFVAPIKAGEVMGTLTYIPPDGGSEIEYELVASRSIERREDAPKSLEEIEAEVYGDPNPFPPFSIEFMFMLLAPFLGVFVLISLFMQLFRRSDRRKGGKLPKPSNRYFR